MPTVLTRLNFDTMDEAALRTDVLMPLLGAMCHKGVTEYHGTTELGKDIVCWSEDRFGNRRNLAVVAKATQMKGRATVSKGTAGEIAVQIQQCFGSTYPDPATTEPQQVHEVWVVSNKMISQQTRDAVRAGLPQSDRRGVTFSDGNELWALVEKHLPVSLMDYVQELRKRADASDTHYKPRIVINGDETSVSIEEKFPGAAREKPIMITTKFAGQAAAEAFHAKLRHHQETGEATEIPAELIHSVEIPDFVKNMFGINPAQFKLSFVPPPTHEFPVRLRIVCDDGSEYVQEYVVMRGVRIGTKGAVIESEQRETPFRLTLKMAIKGDGDAFNEAHFSFRTRESPTNAVQYSDWLRFFTCLSKPSWIQVDSIEHGFRFFEARASGGLGECPDANYADFYQRLATIQQQTKVPITVPERDLTPEEVEGVYELHQIVTTGRIHGTWNHMNTTVEPVRQFLDDLNKNFGGLKPGVLVLQQNVTAHLFDATIPIGISKTTLYDVRLKNTDEIMSRYDELAAGGKNADLEFVPDGEGKSVVEYFDWLPPDQRPEPMIPYRGLFAHRTGKV